MSFAGIALIGLRGAGKSTLGKMLAKKIGWSFVELNKEIEAQNGLSVAEIIALYGQEGFRRMEQAALGQLLARKELMVLATGGGIVSEPLTFDLILQSFYTIWLKAEPEEHMARVRGQGDLRPMADDRSAMAELRTILLSREPLYARASAVVDTSGLTRRCRRRAPDRCGGAGAAERSEDVRAGVTTPVSRTHSAQSDGPRRRLTRGWAIGMMQPPSKYFHTELLTQLPCGDCPFPFEIRITRLDPRLGYARLRDRHGHRSCTGRILAALCLDPHQLDHCDVATPAACRCAVRDDGRNGSDAERVFPCLRARRQQAYSRNTSSARAAQVELHHVLPNVVFWHDHRQNRDRGAHHPGGEPHHDRDHELLAGQGRQGHQGNRHRLGVLFRAHYLPRGNDIEARENARRTSRSKSGSSMRQIPARVRSRCARSCFATW